MQFDTGILPWANPPNTGLALIPSGSHLLEQSCRSPRLLPALLGPALRLPFLWWGRSLLLQDFSKGRWWHRLGEFSNFGLWSNYQSLTGCLAGVEGQESKGNMTRRFPPVTADTSAPSRPPWTWTECGKCPHGHFRATQTRSARFPCRNRPLGCSVALCKLFSEPEALPSHLCLKSHYYLICS